MSNFIKTHPKEAHLFHVDRRMDMTKLSVTFRNFANAAKKQDVWEELAKEISRHVDEYKKWRIYCQL